MSESNQPGGAVVAAFNGNPPVPQPNEPAPGNEAQRNIEANKSAGQHLYGDGSAREAAQAELGRLKGKLANGTASGPEHQTFRELNSFLYGGGPIPESMRSTMEADPNAPYDSNRDAMKGAYQPAASPEDYKSIASLDGRLTGEQAQGVKDIAGFLGLPADSFKHFEERIAHHMSETGQLEPVDEAYADVWLETLTRAYGGDAERAQTQMAKARAYVERVLSPAQLREFDSTIGATSLAFDPFVLNKLASLYDVHLSGGE